MRQILLLTTLFASVLPLSSCRSGTKYTYTGRVYDGITNAALTGYTIELRWGDTKIRGRVDSEGVYTIEGLPSLTDYSVKITMADYRAFLSNNAAEAEAPAGAGVGTRTENTNVVKMRDAYVYPNSAKAPAGVIQVFLEDSTERPNGTARLRPSANTALADEDGALSTWTNSLDKQSPDVMIEYTGGRIVLDEGMLSLGVSYALTLFNTPNYQYGTNLLTFVAGVSNNLAVTLNRQKPATELHWVRTNIDDGNLVPSGDYIITFDNDIELDPTYSQQFYDHLVKASLAITSPDADHDGSPGNVLVAEDGGTPQSEKEAIIASVRVEGNKLVFRSTLSGPSLQTSDPEDPITAVAYNLVPAPLGQNFAVRIKGRTDQTFVDAHSVAQVPNATPTRTLPGGAATVRLVAQPAP